MRLYHSASAPNPRRVRMFLAEKGIEIPLVALDLARLEQRGDAFSAKNPFQIVPALELDDGSVITESIAICRYLEDLHPEPALFGTTPRERAEVEMWQRLAEFQLLLPIAMTFRHTHPAMREMEPLQIGDWAEVNRARALTSMRRFDTALASRNYLAGERFSVADITGLIALDFTKPARIAIPSELTHLHRWRAEIAARPSARA
ncbi:MAG: glutathione S-transferase [Pseudomonadota bacterium]|nr:glutathione S-transferase [Pseudomonadota bacterium]